jgi:hypothetical protein
MEVRMHIFEHGLGKIFVDSVQRLQGSFCDPALVRHFGVDKNIKNLVENIVPVRAIRRKYLENLYDFALGQSIDRV